MLCKEAEVQAYLWSNDSFYFSRNPRRLFDVARYIDNFVVFIIKHIY
jgi:hypothetical protein